MRIFRSTKVKKNSKMNLLMYELLLCLRFLCCHREKYANDSVKYFSFIFEMKTEKMEEKNRKWKHKFAVDTAKILLTFIFCGPEYFISPVCRVNIFACASTACHRWYLIFLSFILLMNSHGGTFRFFRDFLLLHIFNYFEIAFFHFLPLFFMCWMWMSEEKYSNN